MKTLAFLVPCFVLAFSLRTSAYEAVGPNLATNPGFEIHTPPSPLPSGWHGDTSIFTRDTNVFYSGKASLRFANSDPGIYRLCTATVAARPGLKYLFSARVRTRDIAGDDNGATLCLEWADSEGKWLGGEYPLGVKGTRDWSRVEQAMTEIPTNAARVTLSCYVRKGMTGEAWFDDVRLQRVVDASLRTVLVSPVYRGRMAQDGPRKAVVRAFVQPESHVALDLGELSLLCTTRDASGRALRTETVRTVPGRREYDLTFSMRGLAVGRYEAEVCLVDGTGAVQDRCRERLVVTPDGFAPRVYVDENRRLVVEGKPFFPIGMYWGSINETDLRTYADSAFNCLMPYGAPKREEMDLAHRLGLKVIYSVKDVYVGSRWCPKTIKTLADEEQRVRGAFRSFRDHPALLAWYLNDELPRTYLPRLEAHQRWAEEDDPDHPTWVVLYQYRQVRDYIRTFDVIGTDPYPIARKPASMAADWTAETFRQVAQARPLWQVPQAHNWANYRGHAKDARSPTYEEMRSMAWQCICEGANGIVFYSFYDLKKNPDVPFETQWGHLKRIAGEIDRWSAALLSDAPTQETDVTCVGAVPPWLHWRVQRADRASYLFVVNDGDGEGTVTFRLPPGCTRVDAADGDRTRPVTNDEFTDTLPRLAVRVYTLTGTE